MRKVKGAHPNYFEKKINVIMTLGGEEDHDVNKLTVLCRDN